MGKIWMAGGNGVDLDVVTAGAGDILAGKVIVDKDGNPLMGTMVDRGNWGSSELAAGAYVTVPGGKHGGSGKVTAKSLAAQTGGNLVANKMLSGICGWSNGVKVTGNIASQGALTLNPGTTAKTGSVSGKYMTGNVTVPAVNIPAAYIKKGQVITFPDGSKVTGTWEGYVATPADIYRRGVRNYGITKGYANAGSGDRIVFQTAMISYSTGSIYNEWLYVATPVNLTAYRGVKIVLSKDTAGESSFRLNFNASSSSPGTVEVYLAKQRVNTNETTVYIPFGSKAHALTTNLGITISNDTGGNPHYVYEISLY